MAKQDSELNASDEGAADDAVVDADVVENPEPDVVAEGEHSDEALQPTDGYPAAPAAEPEYLTADDEDDDDYDIEDPEPRSEAHVPDVSVAITSEEV